MYVSNHSNLQHAFEPGKISGDVPGLSTDNLVVRSLPAIVGYGSAVAVILGAFTFTGGRLSGFTQDTEVDEVSRKEFLRKNRRRPVESTVHELGEGRGICAPGYAERRAERIREAYGIDVTRPAPAVGRPGS